MIDNISRMWVRRRPVMRARSHHSGGVQAAGCESLRAIAGGLDDRGIPAVRGGKWSAVQVARLLEGLALSRPFEHSAAGPVG